MFVFHVEHVESPNVCTNKSGEIFSTFAKTVRLFTIENTNVMNVKHVAGRMDQLNSSNSESLILSMNEQWYQTMDLMVFIT